MFRKEGTTRDDLDCDDLDDITGIATASESSSSSLSSDYNIPHVSISTVSTWNTYKDLEINSELFERGIVVIRAASLLPPSESSKTDGTYFSMGSRTLSFSEKDTPSLRKARNLLQQLETFCGTKPGNKQAVLFNEKRREEVFLPFSFQVNEIETGFYLYPWLSAGSKNLSFTGFKKFVSASCFLGSSLKGIDQNDCVLDLIKHNTRFHLEQKITHIDVNSSFSAYETAFFSEFEKLTLLMKKLSKKEETEEEKVQLHQHLPYLDYMLFGVALFIRGRITLHALNAFLDAILKRKNQYIFNLGKACQAQGIILTIGSPFENLFNAFPTSSENNGYATFVLTTLGLSSKEIDPTTIQPADIEINEQDLVDRCLNLLKTNTHHPAQRLAWERFTNFQEKSEEDSIPEKKMEPLEKLFKLANTIMIALAAEGQEPYKTCSLLPLSEKQIQANYDKINKIILSYPAVFNITTVEPIIAHEAYDPGNKGLLFYFKSTEGINKLITKKGILHAAHRNVSHFADGRLPISLDGVLKKK